MMELTILWRPVPAENLPAFNAAIQGKIEVTAEFI
jgi:hypothetical protein